MNRIGLICKALESVYGRPECTGSSEPLDELVRTILSQNTTDLGSGEAFRRLKERFPGWEDVRNAESADLEDSISVGGLARTKAACIKALIGELYKAHNEVSLSFMSNMTDGEAFDYLMKFRGVGPKTAACVLMFALCRPVFPVDTHVHRIAKRLGLVEQSADAEKAQGLLGRIVPEDCVYSLHVNLVKHGKRVCRAGNPKCGLCVLVRECPSADSEGVGSGT